MKTIIDNPNFNIRSKPEMYLSKIDNIDFSDVHTWDYPDFTNAYIIAADYDGVEMTEDQLNDLNENSDFVHEKLFDYLY